MRSTALCASCDGVLTLELDTWVCQIVDSPDRVLSTSVCQDARLSFPGQSGESGPDPTTCGKLAALRETGDGPRYYNWIHRITDLSSFGKRARKTIPIPSKRSLARCPWKSVKFERNLTLSLPRRQIHLILSPWCDVGMRASSQEHQTLPSFPFHHSIVR
jgi:hypothetical protein